MSHLLGSRRSTARRTATVLGVATIASGAILGLQPSSASADPSWSFTAFNATYCRQPTVPTFGGYWLGSVTGTWDSTISVGLEDVPGVGTIPGARIAPGSNTNLINAEGPFSFAMPAVGTYTVEAYATDGTTTETSPITFVVKANCNDGI